MTRNNTLTKAVLEEQKRRTVIFKEFRQLFDIYLRYVREVSNFIELKTKILEKTLYLNNLITQIRFFYQNSKETSFPFKTNKNPELLKCANEFIREHGLIESWDKLLTIYPIAQDNKTKLGLQNNDYKGTSAFNCVQTAIYITISELNITHELHAAGIYNVTKSPLIQTTALPNTIQQHILYQNLTSSIFFYKDDLSPPQGELLFFTLGYSFGGSRSDTRYHNKELRAEDCSSAVAKWIGSDCALTTSTMKLLFDNNCQKDPCCNHVKTIVKPLSTTLEPVASGDIYVFQQGGHMGIVTEILNDTCFESLAYSRTMPEQEGLGYAVDCLTTRDYFFFTYLDEENSEL